MRRAIYNDGDFEVRIAPGIEQKVSAPGFLQSQRPVSASPVEIDYVIVGKVTDFHHTAALPKDASRWGLFGRRKEAVVAIEWRVVDVQARRVVAADHTYGTAEASRKKSVEELYAGLDVSAYLFWNTPLGRAAHQAVDKSIERMRELLPNPAALQRFAAQLGTAIGAWLETHAPSFAADLTADDRTVAGAYLAEELAAERPRFVLVSNKTRGQEHWKEKS